MKIALILPNGKIISKSNCKSLDRAPWSKGCIAVEIPDDGIAYTHYRDGEFQVIHEENTELLLIRQKVRAQLFLNNSEWTQNNDNELSEAEKKEWKECRKKIRNIRKLDTLYTEEWPKAPGE